MAQPIIQPAFNAGELAPSLYSRVDLAKYHSGAALLRNMFVDYRGGASNRTGTLFVCESTDSSRPTRLIPFVFSTIQAYALVFSHLKMQVVMNGARVIDHTTGLPFTLVTPYDAADLALLKFTQSADVMTICHPNYPPKELTRTAHDAWTITSVSFVSTAASPTGVTATPSMTGGATDYLYVVTAIAANGVTESLPSAVATAANSDVMTTTAGANQTVAWSAVVGAQLYNVYRAAEVPGGSPASGQLLGFVGSTTGLSFVDANIAPDFTRTPPIDSNPFATPGVNPGCTTYFQQRQVFAATLAAPQTFWMSKSGDYHNFGYSQPSKADDSIIGTIAGQQVNAIKHLVPMGSLIALSSSGAYKIDGGSPGTAITPSSIDANPQAFNGCSDVPPIVVNYDILYVQSKGSIVRDLAYNFYVNTYTGSDMTPLANHLFFGHQIVEWAYAEEPFKIIWAVRDDGILLSFTYVKDQEVYAWSHHDTKGKYLSVCSIPEGDEDAVYVIVKRFIGGVKLQFIERMASRNMGAIPEGVPQDLTIVTKLPPVPTAAIPVPADLTRAWFVDSGLQYPLTYPNANLRPTARTAELSVSSVVVADGGIGYTAPVLTVEDETGFGAQLQATVAAGIITAVTVVNAGAGYTNPTIVITDATGTQAVAYAQLTRDVPMVMSNIVGQAIQVGDMLRVNHGWGTVRAIQNNGTEIVLTVNVLQDLSNEWPADFGEWTCTTPVSAVSGLDHLEGETVSILADGNVMPQQRVLLGRVTLEQPASAIVVGLPYTAQLKSLYIDTGEMPTIQGKPKKIPRVTVRVQDSRGFKVGIDFDHLDEPKERDFQVMGQPILPFTGDRRLIINSDWNVPGQVCIQVEDPLPVTVLGLIPELTVGDTPA